ncbi:NAD(P)H-dependent oxidoreductase [Methylobacillus gramineus]|uniref:NADPH-dependent FMN reductase n=1 Tax=Methylobacillus gramineus TaxID=755169 RepID=UPI001CFFE4CF|nr:NADPH-dependent FMN reductase [Methylobacillus gramineus]MCB5185959.1 NAD(P)H-dependent oxidoreductase [Methylobacillus gramineus]
MTTLLGISGSLRKQSYNTALLHAASALAPAGVTIEVVTLHGIPLYDGDLEEQEGIPPAVQALKQKIIGSDGVILATPEYNNSIPGVFKNAIDWLSRPSADIQQVFGQRAFALVGATPSGFGTLLSQNAWLSVLRQLGAYHWTSGRLLVSRAHEVFDSEGQLQDKRIKQELQHFIQEFTKFTDKV